MPAPWKAWRAAERDPIRRLIVNIDQYIDMTRRIPLALAALLAAAPVVATALPAAADSACTRPDRPKLPPGKKSKGPEMEAAEKKVGDYTTKMTAYLKCLDKAKTDAMTEHKGVIEEWNGVIDAYKKNPG
ncbi:hypothetical protein FBZ89_106226 [Nitrospirillum amazonense]|uniref:Uncharacterized protein n=2 Tax=Nitrospirillum amazonense TaxID=28077 RepID=A0A560FGT3_9PROT|nr:hypothetical protein FBZ89_106226 [Nitrospirillum amazonense]